ncbi:hypothetical protein MINS_18800 [Mycolicibacterium insubricum]|jgi:hypothetical protein|uniref:hypothetical protein n=2 Tax=Mycolicibacterium insubricum TaxID=444597 RepID=UPI00138D0E28|nr:hypothetical protein [Mycolicibacterium insubricum]MCV7080249.1 hypothetical protein [Mycolicibacterium insubricum]BBZ66451.1 hypothetical protein MINS_18800 [Mycolicibacterium insubricum]
MWLAHFTVVALPLLLIPTAALLACARWGMAGLSHGLPDDVKALVPEFTATERHRGTIFSAIFLIALILAVFLATYTWIDGVHATGFLQAFGMAFATLFAFCLIDLVIIDWGLVCWLRPSWIVVRGTEQAEGWGDYMFHVREQLSPKGLAAMFGIPVVVAAAATALRLLS